jgi:NAD(P)-dependent dehydrogenase (short-subunit alcohol dehydrogenase family)
MKKFIDLTGKTIVVVGASSGIGEGIALGLNELGAKVSAISRRGHSDALQGKEGINQVALDVRDQEGIAEYVKGLPETAYGLVYCAGRKGKSPITTMNDELLDDVFNVNYKGFIYFIKELVRNRKIENGGSILGISSIASHIGIEGMAPYSSSKAAMAAAVRVLGRELARRKIRTNAISPGMVRTPIFTPEEQDWLNGVAQGYPLGLGEVEDVAAAAAFFMSANSHYITGTDLMMTGGCPWLS